MRRKVMCLFFSIVLIMSCLNSTYANQSYVVTYKIYGALLGTTKGTYYPTFRAKEIVYKTEVSYSIYYLEANMNVYNNAGNRIASAADEKIYAYNTMSVDAYWEHYSTTSASEYRGAATHKGWDGSEWWTVYTTERV